MDLGNPENKTLRKKLLEKYESLDKTEQAIIETLSIIYDQVSRTALIECLRKGGIRMSRGNAFDSRTIASPLSKLTKLGLVEKYDYSFRCHELISEELTRRAVASGLFKRMAKVVSGVIELGKGWDYQYFKTFEQGLREIRLSLYQNKAAEVLTQVELCASQYAEESFLNPPLVRIMTNPFDPGWMSDLPEEILFAGLWQILEHSFYQLLPNSDVFAFLKKQSQAASGRYTQALLYLYIEQLIFRGQIDEAVKALEKMEPTSGVIFRAWIDLLSDNKDMAILKFETSLALAKKRNKKKKVLLQDLPGIFFILALLGSGEPVHLKQAVEYIDLVEKKGDPVNTFVYATLKRVVSLQLGEVTAARNDPNYLVRPRFVRNFFDFISILGRFWLDDLNITEAVLNLEDIYSRAEKAGYMWLATEAYELLGRIDPDTPRPALKTGKKGKVPSKSIVDLVVRKEKWERALEALIKINEEKENSLGSEKDRRLVWMLSVYDGGGLCSITPLEQKVDPKGNWTKGRKISLKRLSETMHELDFLTSQDRQICETIRAYQEKGPYGYGTRINYEFEEDEAAKAMVGHPLLFWSESPTVQLELTAGKPELVITKRGRHLQIKLQPLIETGRKVALVKDGPTRLKMIRVNEELNRMAEIIGFGLKVPVAAQEKAVEAITAMTSLVSVQSDISLGYEVAEQVMAEAQPVIHLLPYGQGLKLEVLIRPFGHNGPCYHPGVGGETVFAEVDGRRLAARRDMAEEKSKCGDLINGLSVLTKADPGDWEWVLENPEDCLELLLELKENGESASIEWPQGESLKLKKQVSFKQLALTIKRDNDWFNASGELRVDDSLVLDMKELLELMEESPGRFIPLDDGQYLALTRQFYKKLQDFKTYSEKSGQGFKFHPLATLALEELTEEAGSLTTDASFKKHLKRFKEARTLSEEVPSTFQGRLRDYQIEGYQWLVRLAHWGVGACLADDMGLGKTMQALALVLKRADQGPSLVVAPTSVCLNWVDEAMRFTPTLNPIILGQTDREETVEALGPFDVLVTSYGLLQQENKILKTKTWRTIVLDEAQAIKNMSTQRSKAAMSLQGEFKMITTGTPIENHLGELWNLFRFINAGLLGSLDKFNERFASPIEKYKDTQARSRLKRLIQPFILRRNKSQVLEELPSRTEILLQVELSEPEVAFYEALRRNALDKLSLNNGSPGQNHLRILAEIMKLRRACCHSRLVDSNSTISSTKLAVFGDILTELLDNGHKALIFSQFVDHLRIVRETLEERKVAYQYLDGSTPLQERKKRVDAFQAGQGDVFLISLRAGGVGLNLTAADYVLHLDPWWNPAVEDQASDRAHRIGQQRPVTIYRLVAKDTIEQKIVNLHRYKKDLADSLLEGSDMSGKITAEELLKLLTDA